MRDAEGRALVADLGHLRDLTNRALDAVQVGEDPSPEFIEHTRKVLASPACLRTQTAALKERKIE